MKRAPNGTGERIIVACIENFERKSNGGAYITIRAQSSGGKLRRIRLEWDRYELYDLAQKQAEALRKRATEAEDSVEEFVNAVTRQAARKTP